MNYVIYKTEKGISGLMVLIEQIIDLHGGKIVHTADKAIRINLTPGNNVVIVSLNREWWGFHSSLGKILGTPWMHLMLQEKSFWEYSLHRGEVMMDIFSTCPEQWGRTAQENEKWRGSPHVLAREWGIDIASVERYIRNWDLGPVWVERLQHEGMGYRLKGKAYPLDRSTYGCLDQVYDFMRALGFVDFSSSKKLYATLPK
jgi:hypothetical protein